MTRQPQYLARINPIHRGSLLAAFNFANGLFDSVSGNLAVNVGTTRSICPIGAGITAATAGFNVPWNICANTSNFTITVIEHRVAAPTNYWFIFDGRGAGSDYYYGLNANPEIPNLADGALVNSGYCVTSWHNNAVYRNKSSLTVTGPYPNRMGGAGVRFFGRYTDSDPYSVSTIVGLYVHNKQLTQQEHSELVDSPWQIFASSPRRIWFDAGAGGGAVTLAHQDSTQTQSVDNVLLSASSSLAVQDSTHTHASENVVLDAPVSTNLTVQDSTQNHSSENTTLTVNSSLVLQDSIQAQTSDNTSLTSNHSLIVQEDTHSQTSENLTLDSGLILTIADSLSTQQAESLQLLAACLLSVDDSTHTQLTDSIDLSTLQILTVSEATQAITSESPALTIPGTGGTGATAEEIAAAVLAALEATTIPVDIKKVNSVSITGIGTDPNPWRAV